MFKGAQEAMKGMGDQVMSAATKYIDHYPKITGVALVAIAAIALISMAHLIDTSSILEFGGTMMALGLGGIVLRSWLVNRYGQGKSTYVHNTLKNSIAAITALSAALLIGGGFSMIGTTTSFFDGASLSNIPIFGAAVAMGGAGTAILLGQWRNKTYRKVLPIVGVLGYIASVSWMMANFYINNNPYSAGITSILLVFAAPLMQKAIITVNQDDDEPTIEMQSRRLQPRNVTTRQPTT